MTKDELKKLHVITCALEGKFTVAEAAIALGLSERRIKQLKKEVKEHGVESVIHGNRGRKPAHTTDDMIAKQIVELKNHTSIRRPISCTFKSCLKSMKILEKIKERLKVRLNFVLNSVIPVQVTDFECFMLESGLIDIVTIARDDIYEPIKEYIDKKNFKMVYEASRFYNYIGENKGILLKNAGILTYGFEHELPANKNEEQLLCFIANERCYDKCEFKIEHNTNVLLRNLEVTLEKFSCPYKDKRQVYSHEKVERICRKYNIDLLKFCDRTMTDKELLEVFQLWFPFIKSTLNQVIKVS